jgi:UDP-N-acetylglucosamine 2-epimerase (non-hydrolysing)
MPEEINRILTDSVADFLFVSEKSGVTNLRHEGVDRKKIFFVGNVMIDSLRRFRIKARRSTIRESLGVKPGKFTLVTLHRPSNVDIRENLTGLIQALEKISATQPVIFPVHPRTRKMMDEFALSEKVALNKNIIICEPMGYLDFLCLLESSALVITDSGGIQEETTYLGVPCFTMRENTERPVTVSKGTNRLMGFQFDRVAVEAKKVLSGRPKKGKIPALWDGKAAERIARIIAKSILPN